jgi:hypothetical protein
MKASNAAFDHDNALAGTMLADCFPRNVCRRRASNAGAAGDVSVRFHGMLLVAV